MHNEKSPCVNCEIHLRKLNKKDARQPCATCMPRLKYADRVRGMPTRLYFHDATALYNAAAKALGSIDDALKIVDVNVICPGDLLEKIIYPVGE